LFESAEIGQKLSKEAYAARVPELREALLEAQDRLADSDLSVVIVIAGVEGAGKGETVNTLLEWLDTRGVTAHALGLPSEGERTRPRFWRFWRRLPRRGTIGIFFGSWYTDPIVDRIFGRIGAGRFERELARIAEFERMLHEENTLILKYWGHVTKKQQKKRFKQLAENPDTAWRVTKRDWDFHATYDPFVRVAAKALRKTSRSHARWEIIEAWDERYRTIRIGEHLLAALEKRLDAVKPPTAVPAELAPAADGSALIIRTLDLSKSLDADRYDRKLTKYQGRLGRLARRLDAEQRSAVVVFEGPDAAGKGGAIRRIVKALDARFYRVIQIAKPTDEERAQPYLWRFWRHLPRFGEFTIFDRSWYGRVLVERVERLCPEEDWQRAYAEINAFEDQLVDAGVLVFKFWLAIDSDEQLKRFREREATGYKRYKLTDEDWRNREKWGAYDVAASEMVARTSTEIAPWTLVEANDKRHARVKVLRTLCDGLERAVGPDEKPKKR